MRLRTIIFLILFALGILPIITLVAINLAGHIERHEVTERERAIAQARSDFVTLNSRISNLKKTLQRIAAAPAAVALTTGLPVRLDASADLETIRRLLLQFIEDDQSIHELQLISTDGRERLRLRRNHRGEFVTLPDAQLRDATGSALFVAGIQLAPRGVLGELRHPGGEAQPAPQSHLTLATPALGAGNTSIGLAMLTVDTELFLTEHRDAYWVHPSGDILSRPPAPADDETDSAPQETSALREFPGVQPQLAEPHPFLWESRGERKVTWLPVVFADGEAPAMWIGTPIDRSGAQEWKQALIRNILWIVLGTMVVVAAIASLIAAKIDRIKEAILSGLDRILNREEDDVAFRWTGPREVVNLADELTALARHYASTRKARHEAEAALKESETKFRNLTATAQDAIAMMDHHGDISYWNKAAAELFGYSEQEALGKPIHTLISPRLSEAGQKDSVREKPAADGPIRETIELITRRKDGSEVAIELSLSEARIKDQWHSIWIIRDTTERRRAEEETRLQQQQLIQADKMISLGLLVSGVAHEINNPNSIAMLNTAMLSRAWESILPILEQYYEEHGDFLVAGLEYSEMREQLPRLLAELDESARRIRSIVQDLKDYARKDTTRHMDPIDVNAVAEAAIRLTHNKLGKSTRRFTADLAPALPMIRGNAQRLEQVVINLLQNSCEALTSDSQAIRLATRYHETDRSVRIVVEDEGSGIAGGVLHQITDPFFTTKRALGGTGLGLSVSAGIVKEHNGSLHFASTPGQGTIATAAFPAITP
ncbi:MAG: PAS domain S-box protein [Thermodesulfobacteriota bacterium]